MTALMNIQRAIDSSITLRNKRDLILAFVDSVNVTADPADDWRRFVEQQKTQELDQLIDSEGLKPDETRAFVDHAFRDGAIPTTGTAITTILPPVSRFSPTGGHAAKKKTVLDMLTAFFDRFHGPPPDPAERPARQPANGAEAPLTLWHRPGAAGQSLITGNACIPWSRPPSGSAPTA